MLENGLSAIIDPIYLNGIDHDLIGKRTKCLGIFARTQSWTACVAASFCEVFHFFYLVLGIVRSCSLSRSLLFRIFCSLCLSQSSCSFLCSNCYLGLRSLKLFLQLAFKIVCIPFFASFVSLDFILQCICLSLKLGSLLLCCICCVSLLSSIILCCGQLIFSLGCIIFCCGQLIVCLSYLLLVWVCWILCWTHLLFVRISLVLGCSQTIWGIGRLCY